jgi:hypothetical protein
MTFEEKLATGYIIFIVGTLFSFIFNHYKHRINVVPPDLFLFYALAWPLFMFRFLFEQNFIETWEYIGDDDDDDDDTKCA